MNKEKKCPLEYPEWIHLLATETTLKRHDYYNKELSFLTRVIMLLTVLNGVFVFVSIVSSFEDIPVYVKILMTIFIALVLVLILIIILKKNKKLKDDERYMNGTINALSNIICTIINGELIDTNEIRKKYMDIWDKEEWKKNVPKEDEPNAT